MDTSLVDLDNKLTLTEAGHIAGVSPSAVFRWIRDGVHGVKLAHARLGRKLYTSKPAITRFMNDVAQAREAEQAAA